MKRFAFALALVLVAAAPAAQTPPQTLFPGLTGQALRDAIVATYGLASAPSEDEGKDLMYSEIDREVRGGLPGASCIYTDFFVAFDCVPNCDPSQDVFNDGDGLNQEHTWPKAQGADSGLFERDLHHLFPSRVDVNADRGDFPFGDSPDAQTTAWYYLDQQQSSPPPLPTRDLWSELQGTTRFEPREARKGDVARAMFHAYALYGPDGTGQASTPFWEQMRPYLLGWHRADPATADDRARSDRVAAHQTTVSGATAFNPFVVDSSLAARAFYPETLPNNPDVAVSAVVTSGAVVPSTGGQSCFEVTVANHEAGAVTVDVWMVASGPEAAILVTRFLRTATIPGGQSPRGNFCQAVPGSIPDGRYTVTFSAGDFGDGTVYASDAVEIVKGGLARGASALAAEAVTASPNPFAGAATIRFALAEPSEVTLAVYDGLGREVARLVEGPLGAGAHAVPLDAGALPAGVYVYRLQAGSAVATGRLVRLR
jgi:endonuclease I